MKRSSFLLTRQTGCSSFAIIFENVRPAGLVHRDHQCFLPFGWVYPGSVLLHQFRRVPPMQLGRIVLHNPYHSLQQACPCSDTLLMLSSDGISVIICFSFLNHPMKCSAFLHQLLQKDLKAHPVHGDVSCFLINC